MKTITKIAAKMDKRIAVFSGDSITFIANHPPATIRAQTYEATPKSPMPVLSETKSAHCGCFVWARARVIAMRAQQTAATSDGPQTRTGPKPSLCPKGLSAPVGDRRRLAVARTASQMVATDVAIAACRIKFVVVMIRSADKPANVIRTAHAPTPEFSRVLRAATSEIRSAKVSDTTTQISAAVAIAVAPARFLTWPESIHRVYHRTLIQPSLM